MALDRKLRKKLEDWNNTGLLSTEQKSKIIDYEENHASTHGFLFAFAWLAAACIALGIIALIASNWEDIPASMKLIVYFLGFAGLGSALLFTSNMKPILHEVLRLFLMGYALAGIGLVAQIYHLHSVPWHGIAFWCVISLPIALGSTTLWGPVLWIPWAVYAWLSSVSGMHWSHVSESVAAILTGGVLGIFGSLQLKRFSSLGHFRNVAFILTTTSVLIYTIAAPYDIHASMQSPEFFSFLGAAILWSAVVWFQPLSYDFGTRLFMIIFLAFATLQFPLHRMAIDFTWPSFALKIISCALFVAGTLSLAISAFSHGQERVFEILCIFTFLRLLALYTESMMSLSAKGFALISVGLLILGGLYAWKKWKPVVIARLEGKLHAKP